jgi:hypothetical protein
MGTIRALLCVAALTTVASAAAQDSGRTATAKPPAVIVLHPRFSHVAAGTAVFTNGRYVLLGKASTISLGSTGTIIDEQTGRRIAITTPPNCSFVNSDLPNPLAWPWLLALCSGRQRYVLYDARTGSWQPLTPEEQQLYAGNVNCRRGDPLCGVTLSAIGSDWVEFTVGCGYHCEPTTLGYQSIATGGVKTPALTVGGSMIPDINSPTLMKKLCSPLRVPRGFWPPDAGGPLPGSVHMYGRLAIAEGWSGTTSNPNARKRLYLERCGSRARTLLDPNGSPWAASSRAVVWTGNGSGRELDGVFLPSTLRFAFRAPSAYVGSVQLSSRKLYITTASGVWSAPTPTQPAITGR